MAQNYNARRNPDGTWHVQDGSGQKVKDGFKDRAAAQTHIADLMNTHARKTEKGK